MDTSLWQMINMTHLPDCRFTRPSNVRYIHACSPHKSLQEIMVSHGPYFRFHFKAFAQLLALHSIRGHSESGQQRLESCRHGSLQHQHLVFLWMLHLQMKGMKKHAVNPHFIKHFI